MWSKQRIRRTIDEHTYGYLMNMQCIRFASLCKRLVLVCNSNDPFEIIQCECTSLLEEADKNWNSSGNRHRIINELNENDFRFLFAFRWLGTQTKAKSNSWKAKIDDKNIVAKSIVRHFFDFIGSFFFFSPVCC